MIQREVAMPDYLPISELTNLRGKGAVITGGATGIGLAIATRLAEAGAAVLLADLDGPAAEASAADVTARGYQTFAIQCDVADEASVARMTAGAVARLGSLDILVNNAGIYPRMFLEEMSAADFEKVTAVNLTGTWLCAKYAAARMKERRRGGVIINLASIEAVHPASAGMTAYDASKGGVLMLTKSLAKELGPDDIRVNAIAPGAILTRALTTSVAPGEATAEILRAQKKELKQFMSRMALGRLGEADDIARAALFLASEMASYITGEMLVVDGGYLIS
jgi:NAD(P)-dependent dehydrogenase (short-subunit alcohol dehydrogenase family)